MTPLHRACALSLSLLLTTSARATEHDWPAPPPARAAEPRVSFSLTNRAGLVEAPFVTAAFPEISGFATVLTPAAAVHVTSLGWLHAKLPITYVRLDFPAGAQVGEVAAGNLELAFEHHVKLHRSTRLALLAALLAPTADHGPETSLLDNRTLALGSALNGGKDSFLLTPGVTGLRLGASVGRWHHPFQFRAGLDVPLLLRLSEASLPADAETHAFGVTPALDLDVAWWMSSWFGASLGAALVMEAVRVQEPARGRERDQRLQPILEPSLHFQLGQHVRLALDASVPVGGALGGDTWSIGLMGRFEH